MRKEKGFSLIELLLVVVIILVIAAIAIPNLLRSRLAANESSAVASLHSVNTSELVYSTTFGQGFSPDLASLGGACSVTVSPTPTAACLLDPVLANDPATKSGYLFTYTPTGSPQVASYTITGTPTAQGTTGQRSFFTDQSEIIRADPAAAATITSSPI
jgi:type IV pilus assembly protein PilA